MATRNDEGEFELVLGNKQLISVFLIVVILLGVFFSMGYIVGRNAGASSPTTTASNTGKPIVVEHPTPTSQTPAAPAQEPAAPESKAAPPDNAGTHPERAATPQPVTPAPVKTAPAAKDNKPSPMPPPSQTAAAPAPAAAAPARVTGEPPSGDYWQVVATSRPDAEIISEALNKKGMHSILAPAPKEGVFRVLVGPLKGTAAQGQMRADLEAAGFKNPILRKY